ncbi:MAG: imidazolonepropionase [Hyphococcus sp.]|nr:MAG: imidazolonepropionase [Marinicaulis sp.]
MWDTLWLDGRLATFNTAVGAPYGLIDHGAVATSGGKIAWVGPVDDLPGAPETCAQKVQRLDGALMTPGLIDCHTHLVFGGNRAKEFEARLLGKSYEEIAREGGGILSTVRATRNASEDDLLVTALSRLDAFIAEGVTTIEIKSGYGLDLDNELKMLRVIRRLESERQIRVRSTFLGAHALPSEFADRPDAYIDFVCNEILPAAHAEGLVDAVDGFCENIGFSPAQIERVFQTATSLGLSVKLHAEQLSDQGGSGLAAKYNALSADHLEYLNEHDALAMAKAGTVAVLLPGAYYYLRETKCPPIDHLRKHNVPMAIATDCNPGTSPMTSLLLAMNMGCTFFHLTPEEVLTGATSNAARALGIEDKAGSISVGKNADFAIWNADAPAELAYNVGQNLLKQRIFAGTS